MARTRVPHPIAPDLLERARARFQDFPLIRDWGLTVVALQPGRATMALEPGEATMNGPHGVVNGGVLATLADIACALALSTYFDGRMPFATSDLHIRYLEPAEGRVTAEAAVIRATQRSGILECQLLCADQMVCLCTAHFAITGNA